MKANTEDQAIGFAIFDMDGLLIDSEPFWVEAQKLSLKGLYGLELSCAELMQFQGSSSIDFCRRMSQRYGEYGVQVEPLLDALLEHMSNVIALAGLMPGALELLERLADQGVPLAIASSSPLRFIERVVLEHKLPVTVLASGTEVPFSKPHPEVFLLAAHRLGAKPWQCRVWEDSLNGVIAAKAAGMSVVAVPEPDHPAQEKFAIADYIHQSLLDSLAEYGGMASDSDITL